MAIRQQRSATSRRNFLRNAGIVSLAAASGLATADLALAAKASPNRMKLLDLGVMPHLDSAGAVLLETPLSDYLTFRALGTTGPQEMEEVGTAVIELKGCLAIRFRYPGGQPKADDACLADTPEGCCVFEVQNSTWLQRFASKVPARSKGSLQGVRHYVFTFSGNSFECLAKDLDVEVWDQPYSEILAYHLGPVV